jgi:hypothetical protein
LACQKRNFKGKGLIILTKDGVMTMDFSHWTKRLMLFAKQINLMNGTVQKFNIGEKASEEEIQSIENKLGVRLPEAFRHVLKEYAKSVDVLWQFDDSANDKMPGPFKNKVSSGCFYWDLGQLPDINQSKNELVQACFIETNVPEAHKLLNTLAFLGVPNGDYLLIDMNTAGAPVTYLSHEMDTMHGCILGDNFADFIEKWIGIGCVGPEDWQFEPFMKDALLGIDENGSNAVEFREFVGYDPDHLEEAEMLTPEDVITPVSDEDWFHSLLGDTWERKYEIILEEIETGKQVRNVIPAINGGYLDKALYREGVEKSGTHKVVSFKEILNEGKKKTFLQSKADNAFSEGVNDRFKA